MTYETAFRDEETINYELEYETRTRDVPVEREVIGHHSNDSGDGVESEPEEVISAQELAERQAAADAANAAAAQAAIQAAADAVAGGFLVDGNFGGGALLLGDRTLGAAAGNGLAGRGLGRGLSLGGHSWAQVGDYAKFATADSSDDTHVYTVTEYVTEEYQVAKKVPVVTIEQVPYQVAKTEYVTEDYEVETLEPVEVTREIPYTVKR